MTMYCFLFFVRTEFEKKFLPAAADSTSANTPSIQQFAQQQGRQPYSNSPNTAGTSANGNSGGSGGAGHHLSNAEIISQQQQQILLQQQQLMLLHGYDHARRLQMNYGGDTNGYYANFQYSLLGANPNLAIVPSNLSAPKGPASPPAVANAVALAQRRTAGSNSYNAAIAAAAPQLLFSTLKRASPPVKGPLDAISSDEAAQGLMALLQMPGATGDGLVSSQDSV